MPALVIQAACPCFNDNWLIADGSNTSLNFKDKCIFKDFLTVRLQNTHLNVFDEVLYG